MAGKLMQKRRSKRKRTPLRRRHPWDDQTGGFLPTLIPLLALAGKAVAMGALGGAAGFGAKKALEKATK